MNNKFKYILAGLLLIISGSYTQWLEIKPLDKMVLEDYWKTQNDVESVVLAAYRAMQEDGFMERIILGGELRSDNVIVDKTRLRSSQDQVDINDATINPVSNGLLDWKYFYTAINYCNTVLKYAPGVMQEDPNYTKGFMSEHEAEMLTVRALAYFYLVRLYRDVPYIDFPYTDDTQNFNIPKMSGDSILNLQVDALTTAEQYALKSWGGSTINQKGRVTKNTVRALLADIYLWLGKYNECIDACNRIMPDVIGPTEILNPDLATGAELRLIDNSKYYDNSFMNNFYYGRSEESIFELQFNTNVQNNKIRGLYGNNTTTGQLAASPATLLPFTTDKAFTNDLRGMFSFVRDFTSTGSQQGYSQIFKYIGTDFTIMSNGQVGYAFTTSTIATMPWIIYRLADVYLMKAEALVERNSGSDLSDALALVNLTYLRSNLTAAPLTSENYPSQEAMRALVLDERQREFMFEGKRWFDLVRMARREDRNAGAPNNHPNMLNYVLRKYQFNGDIVRSKLRYTDALYLPISWKELTANPALVQNPFYYVQK